MALSDFPKAHNNSVTRSRIYFHRLAFGLKLGAGRTGRSGYPLEIYEPDVDRDGFDIVLNDGDYERHVQVKTVLKSAKTAEWEIRTRLLRPKLEIADWFDLEPMSGGIGGGFLLQEVADTDGSVTGHGYVDYFTLVALERNLVSGNTSAATKTRKAIDDNHAPERTKIRRNVLLARQKRHGNFWA